MDTEREWGRKSVTLYTKPVSPQPRRYRERRRWPPISRTLPSAVLGTMTEIFLTGARLTSLPSEIFEAKCAPTLRVLALGSNQLSSLPEALGLMKSLERLDLRRNVLQWLPDTVCSCTKLLVLDVSFNRLHYLPEAIGRLRRLDKLLLTGNRLKRLPDGLGYLRGLGVLKTEANLPELYYRTPLLAESRRPAAAIGYYRARIGRAPWTEFNHEIFGGAADAVIAAVLAAGTRWAGDHGLQIPWIVWHAIFVQLSGADFDRAATQLDPPRQRPFSVAAAASLAAGRRAPKTKAPSRPARPHSTSVSEQTQPRAKPNRQRLVPQASAVWCR